MIWSLAVGRGTKLVMVEVDWSFQGKLRLQGMNLIGARSAISCITRSTHPTWTLSYEAHLDLTKAGEGTLSAERQQGGRDWLLPCSIGRREHPSGCSKTARRPIMRVAPPNRWSKIETAEEKTVEGDSRRADDECEHQDKLHCCHGDENQLFSCGVRQRRKRRVLHRKRQGSSRLKTR